MPLLTTTMTDDLCEVFIKGSKQGSALAGAYDAMSIAISLGLQYGVPIEKFIEHFKGMNFSPQGIVTSDSDIKFVDSPVDYIARYLEGTPSIEEGVPTTEVSSQSREFGSRCPSCNREDTMVRTGSCMTCQVCGETTGC